MGTATTETLTRTEAMELRQALLERLGMSLDEARERAGEYRLVKDEVALWRRIEALTWLLGE